MEDHVIGTVELPIRRAYGRVIMKPHQVKRDLWRSGKTSRAAVRLACYRLRKMMHTEGWMPVDDVEVSVAENSEDFIRNQRTILAATRCVDRLEFEACGVHGMIRVPRSTSVLVLAVPPDASL